MTARLHDECEYTAHAQPGWHAWDAQSPEQEFCLFIAMLQLMLAPAVIIETGVGTGRLSSFIDQQKSEWLGYEADPAWRRYPGTQDAAMPGMVTMSRGDLVILDSDPNFRLDEIQLWNHMGKPGSVCVVHDAGNGHPTDDPWLVHSRIRKAIEATGLKGLYLANPRGGWLARHP